MKRRDFLKLAAMAPLGVAGVPALIAEQVPVAALNEGRTELLASDLLFVEYKFCSSDAWFLENFPLWHQNITGSCTYPPQNWAEEPVWKRTEQRQMCEPFGLPEEFMLADIRFDRTTPYHENWGGTGIGVQCGPTTVDYTLKGVVPSDISINFVTWKNQNNMRDPHLHSIHATPFKRETKTWKQE